MVVIQKMRIHSTPMLIIHHSAIFLASSLVCLCLIALYKRRNARLLLSSKSCNLPTISWMPKFINYTSNDFSSKRQKLSSSSITNILPRMESLKGPYGIYATVYGISTKVIHIAHPLPAKIVLGSSSILTAQNIPISESLGAVKSPAYDHFLNMFGRGVFTADGQEWKNKRTSVLHCLLRGVSKDNSEESIRLENEANLAASDFLSSWRDMRMKQNGGKEDSSVNIVPLLQRATITLIYRFLTHDYGVAENRIYSDFRSNIDDLGSTSTVLNSLSTKRIHQNYAKRNESAFSLLSTYLEAVTNIRMIILAQSRSFWYILPGWMYKLLSPMYREEKRHLVTIREFARRSCLNSKPGSPLYMLRSRLSHNPKMDDEIKNGTKLSQELMDEAVTLLFAGQDTSAATLSWTLHLLSLNPASQERLVKELEEHLKNDTKEKITQPYISKNTALKMPYLDAVIKESMRLYPVAPFVVRKLPLDLSIPDESKNPKSCITIPKDTFACVWIYSLHRNPKLWHKPNEFIPDRWINPELQNLDEGQKTGSFIPFASGPRNCVGQPLAQIILKIMLARIIQENRVIDDGLKGANHFSSHEEIIRLSMHLRKDMQAGFTVLPSDGVWLNATTR